MGRETSLQANGKASSTRRHNQEVQKYIRALRAADTPISVPLIAAARCIIEAKNRTMLVENGGSINLTRSWGNSLMQ